MFPRKATTFAMDDEEKAQTAMSEAVVPPRAPTPKYTGLGTAASLSEIPTKETAGGDSEYGLTGRDMREAERRLVRKVSSPLFGLWTSLNRVINVFLL
jgi:hypothetical protein